MVFRDNQDKFTDFVFNPLTININCDDDDTPMTYGRFKKLNEKSDSILQHSNAFSSTN